LFFDNQKVIEFNIYNLILLDIKMFFFAIVFIE